MPMPGAELTGPAVAEQAVRMPDVAAAMSPTATLADNLAPNLKTAELTHNAIGTLSNVDVPAMPTTPDTTVGETPVATADMAQKDAESVGGQDGAAVSTPDAAGQPLDASSTGQEQVQEPQPGVEVAGANQPTQEPASSGGEGPEPTNAPEAHQFDGQASLAKVQKVFREQGEAFDPTMTPEQLVDKIVASGYPNDNREAALAEARAVLKAANPEAQVAAPAGEQQSPAGVTTDSEQPVQGTPQEEDGFPHTGDTQSLNPQDAAGVVQPVPEGGVPATGGEQAQPAASGSENAGQAGSSAEASSTGTENANGATVDSQRQQLQTERDAALQALRENPNPENYAKVEALNSKINALDQDPEKLRQSGLEKLQRGETPTDAEKAALTTENIPDVEQSPEQKAEQLAKDAERLGMEAYLKVLKGDGEGVSEALKNFNDTVGELIGARIDLQAAAADGQFIKGIVEAAGGKNPEETAKIKRLREKFQELAGMEIQLRSMAERIRKMQEKADNMRVEVGDAEAAYGHATDQNDRQKKLMEFQSKSIRLAYLHEQINSQKHLGQDVIMKRREVRSYIHRKLGTRTLGYNMLFGAGTAIMQGAFAVENSMEAAFDFVSMYN